MDQRTLRRRAFGCSRIGLSALALLAVGVLAGCGGSASPAASTQSSPAVPASPAAAITKGSTSGVDAVAFVYRTPIAKASYEHWLSVEKALGVTDNPGHQALGFLITSDWVLAEAAARGISVSEAEVKRRLAQLERQNFPKAGSLQRFLARSHETGADLLARVKVEMLQSRTAAQVTAGKGASQRKALLASFQQAFQRHWKSYTTCRAGYVMEDCSEYKGKPEDLITTNSSSAHSASGSSDASASSASSSSGSGSPGSSEEAAPSPGSLAISSPAFASNGAIPTQYTCDGADITPPLQWSNLPAKTAALVLIVIDDTPTGPTSGIRWMVANIDPTAKGVAAGKTPEGGVVGADTQGHTGYGGICPAHGKTSTVEFVLYALSKKIPVSTGFQPDVAEHDYGAGGLLLSSGAVTYGVYHRR
jgi:phosphatidylethanolamine-binding protein (PEBP) family uncharacterized protein